MSQRLPASIAALFSILLLTSCESAKFGGVDERAADAAAPAKGQAAENAGQSAVDSIDTGGPKTAVVDLNRDEPDAKRAIYPGTGEFVRRPSTVAKAETTPSGDITLNFVNADIREVVRTVLGDILRVNYIIDPKVKGTITVQTSRPLTRSALLPTLESIFHANGMTLVKSGSLYKIVPISEATRQTELIDVGLGRQNRGPGFGIQIVPLRFISAGEMQKIIEPLARKGSILRVDTARNLLILAASRPDLRTLLDAVEIFDVDWLAGRSVGLFPLEFADAKTVAGELEKVLGESEQRLAGVLSIMPIERLNALLVISSREEYLDRAEMWIGRLDRGGAGGGERLFVYYVENGKATELAAILGEIFSPPGAGPASPPGQVAPARQAAAVRAPARRPQPAATTQGLATASGQQAPPAARPAQAEAAPAQVRAVEFSGEGRIRVIADEANNALVILANATDYRMVRAAIEKLDVVPLQVLIEATIAEVTLNDDLRYGLQWFFEKNRNEFTLSNVAAGTVAGLFPGFSYLFAGSPVRVAVNALSEITDVKILSSPQLMVLSNKTATLQVGDQVPITTQSAVSVTDPAAPIVNNVEFRDTGVILRVTPRVNKGGLVIMEIEQEVSTVSATITSTIDSPTIQQRKISSTVAVQSGETVVLGGLIQETRDFKKSGVPFLSDIPILGVLFGSTNEIEKRTELLVFITPRIVRDLKEARRVTEELRRRMSRADPLSRIAAPPLPVLKPVRERPPANPPNSQPAPPAE